MTLPARLTPRARQDIASVIAGFEHSGAARKLRHALDAAARNIGRHPEIGRREPTLAPERYRFWQVTGFPYVIIYASDTDPPSIARVVHMARDLSALLADRRELDA